MLSSHLVTRAFAVLALAAAGLPGLCEAQDTISDEDCVAYRGANYDVLYSATIFSSAQTGLFSEHTPEEVHALRCIVQEPDAMKRLQDLIGRGSIAGQLYALAGLRALDRSAFDCQIGRYLESNESVLTLTGDVGEQVPASKPAATLRDDKAFVGALFPDLAENLDAAGSGKPCPAPKT